MPNAKFFMRGLKAKYLDFSLRSKISLALIVSVSVVCSLVMLASYINTYYLIVNHTYELLNSDAQLDKRELEIKLSAAIQSASEVANNFITANALADSQERELYLIPFLKNQRHAFAGTVLSVVDYRGRLIASNLKQNLDYQAHPIFNSMMNKGMLQVSIQENTRGEPVLLLAIPVQYRLSDEVEGGVMLEIPLNAMLQEKLENNFHWLENASGKVIAGKKPILDDLIVSAKHEISLPIPELKLAYYLAHDRERALQKINTMLAGYLGIALMALLGLLAFARFSARYISKPLEYLSQVAQQVTSSGRPRLHINIQSKDEYGALAQAFNTMFARLDDVYQSLEARVKRRTNELESAKAEAEHVRNLLHEAVASATHGFCIFNQADQLVVCNEAYRQFTQLGDYIQVGRSYEEIKTRSVEMKVFSVSIGHEQAWIAERVQHHQKADASFVEMKRADGRWFMAQEVRSPSGYLIASRIDITELKRVTDALTQRELYLQATLDNLPFLFWLKDAQNRFLAINKVYAQTCGLAQPEDAVGKTDFDIWPAALAQRLHADDFEVIASMREKNTEQMMDAQYGASWMEIYKKPVMTEDGKVMGTVGFARDISDRKHVELALAEAEMRWSLAIHGANDGVWDWNLLSDKVFFSERWKSMLGFNQDEIGDSPEEWQSRVHPDDLQPSLDLIQTHLNGASEFYYNEHRLRCKDGSYKWILARGKAFIDKEGKPVRLSGSHTDISDKKLAEVVLQMIGMHSDAANVAHILYLRDMTSEYEVANMKTEFISHAAHELRTPMTSIFGYTELLLANQYDQKTQGEMLEAMQRQSKLIINMINELLDLAKIDAKGDKDFSFAKLDINALLSEIVADLKLEKASRNIELTLLNKVYWMQGDALKISQAILNVYINAEKYSPSETAIKINLVERDNQVGIQIIDRGVGMTPAQIQHVGERFWRADHSGNQPGTGLGMSIVKEIMQFHHGQLEIASKPEQGTTVTLWFPAI